MPETSVIIPACNKASLIEEGAKQARRQEIASRRAEIDKEQ